MEKKAMARLDKINLVWLLEKMSLGNLVRGIIFLTRLAEPVKKCIASTANKMKTVVKEEKAETESKKQKSK